MILTLNDLELTEKDFKFEIIEIGDAVYNGLMPFHTKRQLTVKINGTTISITTNINFELIQDLKFTTGISDIDTLLKNVMKEEAVNAVNCYINSVQYQRKLKLQKIKKMNGI
jgi:hypothetical protein